MSEKTKKVKEEKEKNQNITLKKYINNSTPLSNKYRVHRMSFSIWILKELKNESPLLKTMDEWNELFQKYLKSNL